ncbi:MAG: tryptophan-rich sensory protein [Candidatus Pacebacteria bacterium]|jgi:hypothetical protein|nr:tryptophan-rich sensory protein [Candidatus Paceibacterota bacterium]
MLKNKIFIKILTLITFIIMIVVNALANILPINGITTGEASDAYPNLFAPAGITFSIWGVIYLMLFIYVIYQFFVKSKKVEAVVNKINIYFIISSIANAVWIFLWHYQMLGLSVILMLVILFSLIKISSISNEKDFSLRDKIFFKVPFGVYFGWITIATIANLTTFLVSLGWANFIFPDQIWMIIILLIGMIIASVTAIKEKNLAYGLVPVWAYFGIYLKHSSPMFFNKMYPDVILTSIICILIFAVVDIYLLINKKYL